MERNQNKKTVAEESLLNKLVFKFFPYWPFYLVFIIVSCALAYIYLLYTNPVYEISSTLIIKDDKKSYDDLKVMESLGEINSKNFINTIKVVENEVQVMKSRAIMDTVVKTLHLYAAVYERGNFRVKSAYVTSPVTIEVKDADTYLDEQVAGSGEPPDIALNFNSKDTSVSLNGKGSYKLNVWHNTPYGQLKFIKNKYYRKGNNPESLFFNLLPVQSVVEGVLYKLIVSPSSKVSTVVNLTYKDEVRKRGEDILNELVRSYNTASITDKSDLAKKTLAFVEERLRNVNQDLDSLENQIQNYRTRSNAIDISKQGQIFLENVSANDRNLGEISMQLAVLGQVESFVKSNEGNGAIVPSTGVNNPLLSEMVNKLYSLELDYQRLKNTTAENNPILISIKNQINQIKPNILNNIESERRNLAASKANLNSTNSQYGSVLQRIPEKERKLIDLNRAQAIKSGVYSFLLQKREESALSFSSTVADSRIVNTARASLLPVSPNKLFIYLAAILIGLSLGPGIVALRDLLNGKILFRQQLEKLTTIPVLGEIAYQKKGSPLLVHNRNRSLIAEEFRKVRVSLQFLGIEGHSKKILVTSSIPGEGKSFTAANLAISFSLTDKKVLLVDTDLNNPSLAKVFGTSKNSPGITDYLKGTMSADKIIKEMEEIPNLSFVSTGALPDNPSELISNGKIKQFLEYAEKVFDLIIIDTSPVVPVTDGFLLSRYCDATVFIVRHNYTPTRMAKRLDFTNSMTPIKNPVIVFNGLRTRGIIKNNYGYGYSQGFTYDYKGEQKVNSPRKAVVPDQVAGEM